MFRRIFIPVLLVDILILLGSLALTIQYKYGQVSLELWSTHYRFFAPAFALTLLAFYLNNLYTKQIFRSRYWLAVRIFYACLVGFTFAVLYLYFQPELILTPRRFLLINFGIVFILILFWREGLFTIFGRKTWRSNVLFLGSEFSFVQFQNELLESHYLGFNKIERYVPGSGSLANVITKNNITTVIVNSDSELEPEITSELFNIVPLGLQVLPYLDFYEMHFARIPSRYLSHSWFLHTFKYRRKPVFDFFKRIIDIIFGFVGLMVCTILLPFIAIGIKLSSPGPVFFKGERVGKDGKKFIITKFRTMIVWDGADWAKSDDSRITTFGKFLRRSRIDELPQFWNIFIGNMSLVGPRPEQPHIVQNLSKEIPFYDQRHLIKSGLTGWAQISSGYAGTVDESRTKFEYDLYYIKNRSLAFDFEIIAHTIRIILGLKGR
jgi:exopolysaccharide biosynthesis polyprenyl glycosylphosphotransferase